MIDLSDLGLAPVESTTTTTTTTAVSNDVGSATGIVPGSVKAKVLYAAFAREPVTVIDSPPGAGKSSLIVEVLETLLRRSEFNIIVATPTRRAAADLAGRLVTALSDTPDAPAVVLGVKGMGRPTGVYASKPKKATRYVTLRTISSCAFSPPDCDIMIFDEAYQATYADVSTAADGADQVIMVGDPGQIGPVITQDTSAWERMRSAPHRRAPEVFARRDDATVLQLDATYRLGQATVDAIAPLYEFEFSSKRPERHLIHCDGKRLPELGSAQVAVATRVNDVDTLNRVADLAMAMVGSTVVTTDADGGEVFERVGQGDVAVVVSRSVQASTVQAILRSRGYDDIAVGTADKMQGGQWHAVIALDPLIGQPNVGSHQLSPGRLCVMASRHLTTMVWVHDGAGIERLTSVIDEEPDAKVGIAVRRALTAAPEFALRP